MEQLNGCDVIQYWAWSIAFGTGTWVGVIIAVVIGVDKWRQFFKELLGRS